MYSGGSHNHDLPAPVIDARKNIHTVNGMLNDNLSINQRRQQRAAMQHNLFNQATALDSSSVQSLPGMQEAIKTVCSPHRFMKHSTSNDIEAVLNHFKEDNKFNVIRDVCLGPDPYVFLMSKEGVDSGADLVLRMQASSNDPLMQASFVHFDHVHRKVRASKWKCMGAHVYSVEAAGILTLAIMYVQSEDTATQRLFWQNLKKTVRESVIEQGENLRDPVSFAGFMADAAGVNWLAIKEEFPLVDDVDKIECGFHFFQNLDRANAIVPEEPQKKQFLIMWKAWKNTVDPIVSERVVESLHCFNASFSEKIKRRLTNFMQFHLRHRLHLQNCHRQNTGNDMQESMRPATNLSESIHAAWLVAGGYFMTLMEAVKFDVTTFVRQLVTAINRRKRLGHNRMAERVDLLRTRKVNVELTRTISVDAFEAMKEFLPVDDAGVEEFTMPAPNIRPGDSHRDDKVAGKKTSTSRPAKVTI